MHLGGLDGEDLPFAVGIISEAQGYQTWAHLALPCSTWPWSL